MIDLSDFGIPLYCFTFDEWLIYSILSFIITYFVEALILKYGFEFSLRNSLEISLFLNLITYALGFLTMIIWMNKLSTYWR